MPKVDTTKVHTIKPHYEIICTKYRKPKQVGSLFLPDRWLDDPTGTVYEVVKSNHTANEYHGDEIMPGDIITVRWGHATDLGVETDEGRGLFLVKPEDVQHRIKNTWDG